MAGKFAPVNTYSEFMAGQITGATFTKGVYEWTSDIGFTAAGITITGSAVDTFLFKTTQNFVVGAGANVVLSGGALASNIVWQVGGLVDVGAGAHTEGVFLVKNGATFKTLSSLNGRILAQTAVDFRK